MMKDILVLMEQEWVLTVVIFVLLFISVGTDGWSNESLLYLANGLLLINVISGFFMNTDGTLFGGAYHTNRGIALEKDLLNLGTLLVSLQAFNWLRTHRHVLEFYLLLLSICQSSGKSS